MKDMADRKFTLTGSKRSSRSCDQMGENMDIGVSQQRAQYGRGGG
jgi:hypothetical protein